MTAMTSRAIRAASADYRWVTRAIARLLNYLNLFAAGFADGRELARDARKRYPFVDW